MNSPLDFGILQPFVDDDKVTDINYKPSSATFASAWFIPVSVPKG